MFLLLLLTEIEVLLKILKKKVVRYFSLSAPSLHIYYIISILFGKNLDTILWIVLSYSRFTILSYVVFETIQNPFDFANKKKYRCTRSHESKRFPSSTSKEEQTVRWKWRRPFVHNQLVNSIITSQRAPGHRCAHESLQTVLKWSEPFWLVYFNLHLKIERT